MFFYLLLENLENPCDLSFAADLSREDRIFSFSNVQHRCGKQSDADTLNEVIRPPRTLRLANVKINTPSRLPFQDQRFERSARKSQGVADVVGGSHRQNSDRGGAADQ